LLLGPIGLFWAVFASWDDDELRRRNGLKKCAQCAEWVKVEAIRCPHCLAVV
jgi:hypothetical protein